MMGELMNSHLGMPVKTNLKKEVNPQQAIVYQSGAFTKTQRILGMPQVKLWIAPSESEMQLVAYLYDVDQKGVGTLLTKGPITLYNQTPGSLVEVSIELTALAHDLKSGHSLALGLDTEEHPAYGRPTEKSFTVTIHYDQNQEPKLTVPFIK